ncbi:hypothetical protein R1sor_016321 [Riccia sorocarpa]|uniref:Uncharacterized protein n=1 Tax=Riccia sorocarpa TaxID=122646 RepID=A0ABD3HHW4_9MARC
MAVAKKCPFLLSDLVKALQPVHIDEEWVLHISGERGKETEDHLNLLSFSAESGEFEDEGLVMEVTMLKNGRTAQLGFLVSSLLIDWIQTYHDRHKLIRDAVKTAVKSGLLRVPSKRKVESCLPSPNYAELDSVLSKRLHEAVNKSAGPSNPTATSGCGSGEPSGLATKNPRTTIASTVGKLEKRPTEEVADDITFSAEPSLANRVHGLVDLGQHSSQGGGSRQSGSQFSHHRQTIPDSLRPKDPQVRTLRELDTTQPQCWDRVDKDSIREEAIQRCRVRQDTITISLRQFHIEKPGKDNWLPYQVRPLNEHFVDLLSEKLLARKQPGHNIFIVLVDPDEGLGGPQDFDKKRIKAAWS